MNSAPISHLAAVVILAAPRGIGQYIRQHFFDRTFQGLYHANAFDLALLIPYFVVLVLLASYGVHRYTLVYLYYKNKKNRTTDPPAYFPDLPRVTVQLPIFNEQYVVDRLLDAVCRLNYPREKMDIQVLDDSTDETMGVARTLVERYAALGNPISYHHRINREGFKAGALAEGLKTAKGEFIAIFDADFVPPEDFLLRTIHHFIDPKVGMVQTRWTHINRHYSFLTEVEAILLDGHFVLEHSGRARSGLYFNFNGTAGVWRRRAINEAGGWQHDTLTEDTDLSYRAQLKGWKFIYLQDVECPAELPVEMTAFKTQQARWAKGLIQTGKKILPCVLKSDAPRRVKLEASYHLTANLSYPLMIVLSVLLLPAMVIRFYQGWFQMVYIDLPLFLASTFSISIGKQSVFARTPKYRVESKKDKVGARKYRHGLGWVPWIELLIGSYFALTVYYAVDNENYITVPFLILFVVGYWYTGLMSLLQGRFSGLGLPTEIHDKPFPVSV